MPHSPPPPLGPRPHAAHTTPLSLSLLFSHQVDLDSLSVQLADGAAVELRGVLLDAGAVDALVVSRGMGVALARDPARCVAGTPPAQDTPR